jgi:hypothetical protein
MRETPSKNIIQPVEKCTKNKFESNIKFGELTQQFKFGVSSESNVEPEVVAIPCEVSSSPSGGSPTNLNKLFYNKILPKNIRDKNLIKISP